MNGHHEKMMEERGLNKKTPKKKNTLSEKAFKMIHP